MDTKSHQDALRSRWTLEGRIPLAGVAEHAAWHRARSVATGEAVTLLVVAGPAALETADAARRAYLVEDPRLLPVTDVVVLDDPRDESADGSVDAAEDAPGPLTVVEYPLPSAPPLAALLSRRAIHAETARSIIGEAAKGLETARRRGIRHQFIDSNRVFVDTASGQVTVLGVGVEAASHPGLIRSGAIASFQDTAALVALLYRALSGRSPVRGADEAVPPPSQVSDRPVPKDLDLLCDLVLNESSDQIPETTRELIAELEPWQSIPVTLEAYDRGEGRDAGESDAEPELESTALMAPVPEAGPDSGQDAGPEAVREREAAGPESDGAAAEHTEAAVLSPPSAAALTGAAGAAGAAAAVTAPAAAATAAPRSTDPASAEQSASPSGDAADSHSTTDPAGTTDAGTVTEPDQAAAADQAPAAAAAAAAAAADQSSRTAQDAQAIIRDLHLDEKRSQSAFPGHLDITLPRRPRPEDLQGTVDSQDAPATQDAQDSRDVEEAQHAPASLQPFAGAVAQQPGSSQGGSRPTAARRSGDDPHVTTSTGPVEVSGRTISMATPVTDDEARDQSRTPDAPAPAETVTGPIVVRGRDRSELEGAGLDHTVPSGRPALLRDVVNVAVDADDPRTFALGPLQPEERSRQAQWILLGAALMVIVVMVIAISTITSDLRETLDNPLNTSPAAEPSSATPSDQAAEEPTEEATEEAPQAPAAQLAGVEVFTQGSDRAPDNDDQTDRMTDGDPGSFWSTQIYQSPQYGGLKDGAGVRLDLGQPSTLTAVVVTTARNSGGVLELRAVGDDGSLGDVLATGEFAGDGEVRLAPAEPVQAQRVALWIPELPADSQRDGFRGRIAELRVE